MFERGEVDGSQEEKEEDRKIGSRGSKYVLKRRSRWNSGRRRRRRRESRGRED